MKLIISIAVIAGLAFSQKNNNPMASLAPQVPVDTITHLNDLTDKAIFKATDGRYFNVHFESATNDREQGSMKKISKRINGILRTTSVRNQSCDNGNSFDGSYRAAAKESYVTPLNSVHSPSNLQAFITSLQSIPLSSLHVTAGSPRIVAEKKNIRITAFLYAITRESDEDYHIIIGTNASGTGTQYFNIECAGLPPTGSVYFSRLKTVRKQVTTFMNGEICHNGYIYYDDHPKVQIKGSLFYDKQHEHSIVGPACCKPPTAWELHPITYFKVL